MSAAADLDPAAREAITPFVRIGGEPAIRAIVDRFYDLMQLDAAYAELRALHPADLSASSDKLFWYLCGWLGGPQHYVQRFGHPRLRARHLPYTIDQKARDQWLRCMGQALAHVAIPQDLLPRLDKALTDTADWMRNSPG